MPNLNTMNNIILDNHQLTYTITYQKGRKSIQLKIVSPHHVAITAPNKYPKESIEEILRQKSNWILKQISHLADTAANPLNKSITNGSQILYLGKPHTLILRTRQISLPAIQLHNNQILLGVPPATDKNILDIVPPILRHWYIECASKLLSEKTSMWSAKICVQPQRITIKEQKTRWGSCSSKGNINYNWRIIMAPPEVIDYLVIHELCHLRVPNHSDKFWNEVSKFSVNYKLHRAWLRTNGLILMDFLRL